MIECMTKFDVNQSSKTLEMNKKKLSIQLNRNLKRMCVYFFYQLDVVPSMHLSQFHRANSLQKGPVDAPFWRITVYSVCIYIFRCIYIYIYIDWQRWLQKNHTEMHNHTSKTLCLEFFFTLWRWWRVQNNVYWNGNEIKFFVKIGFFFLLKDE